MATECYIPAKFESGIRIHNLRYDAAGADNKAGRRFISESNCDASAKNY
jgi:hypothetical protein